MNLNRYIVVLTILITIMTISLSANAKMLRFSVFPHDKEDIGWISTGAYTLKEVVFTQDGRWWKTNYINVQFDTNGLTVVRDGQGEVERLLIKTVACHIKIEVESSKGLDIFKSMLNDEENVYQFIVTESKSSGNTEFACPNKKTITKVDPSNILVRHRKLSEGEIVKESTQINRGSEEQLSDIFSSRAM